MKSACRIALVLATFACSQDDALRLPAAPNPPIPVPPSGPPVPPNSSLGTVWILVVDDSGVCVDSASVTVLSGQRVGESVQQITPCGRWDAGGGIEFRSLTPGVAMTLRVSAPGYLTLERTVLPATGTYTAWEIYPKKIP